MKLTKDNWFGAGRWMGLTFELGLGLGICLFWMGMGSEASAQAVSTTTVQGTVYLANGRVGSGTLVLSWPAFATASGQSVAADSLALTIAPDGFLSVNLAPNLGATPAGLYYTAVYHLSDGTTTTQYWVVPAAAQASLAQVQAQLMPAAQAVQAVNKAYVDQVIAELEGSLLTASGGNLTGPLYLNGDPTQALQAADKHYVDATFAEALPLTGGAVTGELTGLQLGAAYQVDQFPGVDFGAKLQACLNGLGASFGGTCDARNFTGILSMGSNLTISTSNATVLLPCATIATANHLVVTAGTRNVSLRGCALLGGSAASGSQGGTAFQYSGASAIVQVGDPTYAVDTPGFHMDNAVLNTTAATSASAQGLAAYRTQEMNIENLYFLGNANQTGMTLDGTGNYTGGSFFSSHFSGFQTAVNAIGHQVANPATTDWLNASTFVRMHIDCPTSGGSPIAGTYGINLQQGDGNTFTGGDVEGCNTALHLGANAENNTIVGLRNENSNNQVVADAGSSYNNWITGGTMFTGQLTDNGTRNSFFDTFHRSFNGLNGDWYGSQKDATVTNHLRLGTGTGNERGLLNEIQTDYGYRWIEGYSDATAGEQFYQVNDVLNNVNRISIGQYNNGQGSTNNQTVVNSAGTGAVVLNGSNNSGTGGVIIGSGGATESTVATISNAGNAQFNGTLLAGGTSQSTGTMTVRNNADAEVDYYLWPGLTTSQKGSYTYKDWNGNSQWYMVKDASNNWALNSALGGLDSFKAYQSTNSGDTYVNASNSSGAVRVNYESGSGAAFNVYGGNSSTLYASFTGAAAIKFPGLAAASGHNCVQVDNAGFLTNTGAACGTGGGGSGTVNSGSAGQIAYYASAGTTVGGISQVPITAGGTGASTAGGALTNLGAQAAIPGLSTDGANGVLVTGTVTAANTVAYGSVVGAKMGPVFQCDQFSGADVSFKANACNAAAIAAGGGTIDLRTLLAGNTTGSREIEIDTPAGNQALIGVTALLPTTGTYTTTMVGGPATSATVYPNMGGSGYVTGDLVYPVETGFAYTGVAAGAVFSVTASGGTVTALTLVSGGSGYLTSKYVTTTTNHAGTGLAMNLAAADCGMRLNGRAVIQGGSVGAGAASFQIVPASGHAGFQMDSAFCTDQNGGYVRQEGGLKAANPTGNTSFVYGAAHIRNVVDQSSFNLLETSSQSDDGALIDGACCGANFFSLHADAGTAGGYPVIIGPGGVLRNACTTNGSNTITVPYGHLTAKYLGDTLSAGTAGGSSNLPAGATIITAINSLTSMTVSQAANATSGGQAACTTPSLTGGSGLTLHISDPTVPAVTSVSLHNLVSNGPGPGLPNVLVTGQTSGLSVYAAYIESNSAIDSSTSQVYFGYPAGQVNFMGLYAPGPSAGGTKYGVESDTPFGWCMFGGVSNAGLLDQGVKIQAAPNANQTYCKGGLTNAFNGTNLLPDTNFKQGGTYWTVPSGVTITAGAGAAGDNAFTYGLSGTPSGTIYIPVNAVIPNLQLNQTYTIGANINAATMTAGTVSVQLCTTPTCSSHYANATANPGTAGPISATVNAPSFTGPYFAIVISGVAGSGTLAISEPYLVLGITPAYVENDLGFGSSASSGAAFSSVALNGGTPWTSSSSTNSQVVTCAPGGTTGQFCGADGAWHTPGTITGVTAGTGLTGGGSSGSVTVGLSTPVAAANGGTGAATASANTAFGNFTGSSAAPSFASTTGTGSPVAAVSPTFSGSTTTFANNSANTDYLVIEPGNSGNAELGGIELASATGTAEWYLQEDTSYDLLLTDQGAATPMSILTGYAGGATNLSSQGAGAVTINNVNHSGSGGFSVYEGGANYNTLAFNVTSAGNASVTGSFTGGGFQESSGLMNSSAGATTSVTHAGGQDASTNSALGSISIRGANQTAGTGGASSVAGQVLIQGGSDAITNATSVAGGVELVGGANTGSSTPGLPGLFLEAQVYNFTGTYAQWGLVCFTTTAMTVAPCAASPYGYLAGVAVTQPTSTTVEVAMGHSVVPINAASTAALGEAVCAGTTAGKITPYGATSSFCYPGLNMGEVVAITGTWPAYPDGTAFPTLSTSLPLVQMNNLNAGMVATGTMAANTVVKASGAIASPSACIDNGTDWYCTEPMFSASGSVTLAPATGIGTSFTSTGVAFPPTYATTAKVYRGRCHIVWQQITAVSTVTFGVGASVAPTALYVSTESSPGSYIPPYVAANITSTATTAISTAMTPAAAGTNYMTNIDLLGSFTAAANLVTIYAQSGSSTDTISIQPGSYCSWLP